MRIDVITLFPDVFAGVRDYGGSGAPVGSRSIHRVDRQQTAIFHDRSPGPDIIANRIHSNIRPGVEDIGGIPDFSDKRSIGKRPAAIRINHRDPVRTCLNDALDAEHVSAGVI